MSMKNYKRRVSSNCKNILPNKGLTIPGPKINLIVSPIIPKLLRLALPFVFYKVHLNYMLKSFKVYDKIYYECCS